MAGSACSSICGPAILNGAVPACSVSRPAGVEGWLPIAGLMNTKYFLLTGHVPEIHPAAMFLFIGFMLMSLLFEEGVLLLALPGWHIL